MSLQKTATIVSSTTAFMLLMMKFFVGIFSGSIAVLSSAIDSFLDLCVSVFNYFAIHNAEKPADAKFNYGRGKIEALASSVEGVVISISGLYILYESVSKIIYGDTIEFLGIAIIVMGVSAVITGLLVWFLNYVANKTDNLVIKSDALHYKTDLFTNGGILLALGIIHFTGFYMIDGIIGIGISLYIIYEAYPLIKEGVLMLLDVSLDEDEVKQIVSIIESEKRVTSYHFLRTRNTGKMKILDVHLVFDKDIKLIDAHRIEEKIELQVSKIDKNTKRIYNIHLDPYDDSKSEIH